MAKINKKELTALANRYKFYKDNEVEFAERFYGFKVALMELNLIDKIELEVFKIEHKKVVTSKILDNILDIFKRNNLNFRINLLDDYLTDADYMGLTKDDAKSLKNSIEYIYKYC